MSRNQFLQNCYDDVELYQQIEWSHQICLLNDKSSLIQKLECEKTSLQSQVDQLQSQINLLQQYLVKSDTEKKTMEEDLAKSNETINLFQTKEKEMLINRIRKNNPLSDTFFLLQDQLNKLQSELHYKNQYINQLEQKIGVQSDTKQQTNESLQIENIELKKEIMLLRSQLQKSQYNEAISTSLVTLFKNTHQ
ncbi:hypothetical protein WA158_007649 [Blastocystis sp. Blastoise]